MVKTTPSLFFYFRKTLWKFWLEVAYHWKQNFQANRKARLLNTGGRALKGSKHQKTAFIDIDGFHRHRRFSKIKHYTASTFVKPKRVPGEQACLRQSTVLMKTSSLGINTEERAQTLSKAKLCSKHVI